MRRTSPPWPARCRGSAAAGSSGATAIRRAAPGARRGPRRAGCPTSGSRGRDSVLASQLTQRSATYEIWSILQSTLYSCFSRASTMSSCSGPTTPRIGSRRPCTGKTTCIRPSSSSCVTPFSNCFDALVEQPRPAEVLGGEARHRGIAHRRSGVERVADGELAGIGQADDVARVGALDGFALAAEEPVGSRGAHGVAHARVHERHVLLEHPRAHAHEGHAVAMLAVHVRLDLEHEAGEPRGQRATRAPVRTSAAAATAPGSRSRRAAPPGRSCRARCRRTPASAGRPGTPRRLNCVPAPAMSDVSLISASCALLSRGCSTSTGSEALLVLTGARYPPPGTRS